MSQPGISENKSVVQPLPSVNSSLQYYWDLANAESLHRSAAASSLLGFLQTQQTCSSTDISTNLQYALKRLIKGLASSHECARQGFALALTMVCNVNRSIFSFICTRQPVLWCNFKTFFANKIPGSPFVFVRFIGPGISSARSSTSAVGWPRVSARAKRSHLCPCILSAGACASW